MFGEKFDSICREHHHHHHHHRHHKLDLQTSFPKGHKIENQKQDFIGDGKYQSDKDQAREHSP